MSSASMGRWWGEGRRTLVVPTASSVVLSCSSQTHSKAKDQPVTRPGHVDSSLVSVITRAGIWGVSPAIPLSRDANHVWYHPWDDFWKCHSPSHPIAGDALGCHSSPCGVAHQASVLILLWGQLCGHPQITGINHQRPPRWVLPVSVTRGSISWNSWTSHFTPSSSPDTPTAKPLCSPFLPLEGCPPFSSYPLYKAYLFCVLVWDACFAHSATLGLSFPELSLHGFLCLPAGWHLRLLGK